MLFFAFFSSIYTFYINKKWYFRNLLSKIPFCQQSEGYSSLFFMNKHFSKIKLEKICSLVFNNNYGNVIRVKGFYLNNDEWYLFNATKEEITKEKIDLGQDVVIIIGSSLNEEEINKLVNSI